MPYEDSTLGSPPPTRGKPRRGHGGHGKRGITPAYAGKTVSSIISLGSLEDHPRLRGENFRGWRDIFCQLGSPPPTRGKRVRCFPMLAGRGITPAYAGKTEGKPDKERPSRDHPRLRGENRSEYFSTPVFSGSPPPTRGKPVNLTILKALLRITPAYAGKTNSVKDLERTAGDHPRLRGENLTSLSVTSRVSGSPPPTRGKLRNNNAPTLYIRITPAYAGKTTVKISQGWNVKDHPRLRGENKQCQRSGADCRGSPPPTRGKPRPDNGTVAVLRITPAYAGKTLHSQVARSIDGDHPRLRGENPVRTMEQWRF